MLSLFQRCWRYGAAHDTVQEWIRQLLQVMGKGGPEGALFAANESGYFTNDKFTQWLVEVSEKRWPFCFYFVWGE